MNGASWETGNGCWERKRWKREKWKERPGDGAHKKNSTKDAKGILDKNFHCRLDNNKNNEMISYKYDFFNPADLHAAR